MTGPVDPFASRPVPVPRPHDEVAQVITVCTANIARSPLAMALVEHEARRRIGPDAPVWVTSSGVDGLVGERAVEQTRQRAHDRGLDVDAHIASWTDADDVAQADLVITMTERHRDVVLGRCPSAVGWVFTFVELARLLNALQPIETGLPARAHLRAAVRVAHAARLHVPRPEDAEDVGDPFGRPNEAYDRMADQLDELTASVGPQLFGFLPDER